jgi:hypothetical protein
VSLMKICCSCKDLEGKMKICGTKVEPKQRFQDTMFILQIKIGRKTIPCGQFIKEKLMEMMCSFCCTV